MWLINYMIIKQESVIIIQSVKLDSVQRMFFKKLQSMQYHAIGAVGDMNLSKVWFFPLRSS